MYVTCYLLAQAVYKGTWKENTPVAIKMMKAGSMSKEDFKREAKTMT